MQLARKDFNGAREIFVQAEAAIPENPDVLLGLCRVAYGTQNWAELQVLTSRLIAIDPRNTDGAVLRARSCNQARDWAGAATAWGIVCEDRPDWPESWFQLGRARSRLNDIAGSFEAADNLAAIPNRTSVVAGYLIRLLLELGALSRAKEQFDALIQTDPAAVAQMFAEFEKAKDLRGVATCASAVCAVDDGAIDSSLLDHVKATAGASIDKLLDRAANYERSGNLEAAYLDHKAILLLDPQEPVAKRTTARILRTLRSVAHGALRDPDPSAAHAAFLRITQIEPDDQDSWFQLGRTLMRLRDWKCAVSVWQKVISQQPDLGEARLQLARALSRSGREGDSLPVWQQILQDNADNAEARQMIDTMPQRTLVNARAAIAAGRLAEAAQMMRDLKAIDPANQDAESRLEHIGRKMLQEMRSAFKLSEFRRVLEFAKDATELLPDSAEVQLLIARAAMNRRKYEMALPAWKRLAELDPSSAAMCRLQVARCYFRSGQDGKARLAAAEILQQEPDNAEAAEMLTKLGQRSGGFDTEF